MTVDKILFYNPLNRILASALTYNFLRLSLVKEIEKRLYKDYQRKDRHRFPRKLQDDKFCIARNLLYAINRGIQKGLISKEVWTNLLNSFLKLYLKDRKKMTQFKDIHGIKPPDFLTISPTQLCNLLCQGCYAGSYSASADKLDYEIVSRIIKEQKEIWDSHFTVISGGEPLLYKSQGKTILDLLKEHDDTFFLMYTNGTLINDETAHKFAEFGNITPAISVEGFEEETDNRRGKGAYQKTHEAFENLRKAGVPFGISITATRDNAEIIMSNQFMDHYFNQQGALYGWIFQYMPIGRNYSLDMMVSPQQRLEMYLKTWKFIREDGIFLADFWNCGAVSNGCISAGRVGGYIYIDWHGNVMPCVFNPYKIHNIVEVYKQGGNLSTVLFSPFFKKIREWSTQYGLSGPAERMGNIIMPCAIRDHYKMMRDFIRQTNAQPADEAADQALKDKAYYDYLVKYDAQLKELTDVIWEEEYIAPER